MFPNIQIGPKTISAYMIFSLIGVLVALFYTYRSAEKSPIDEFHVLYMLLFSAIGVVLGSHILYGLTNYRALFLFVTHLKDIRSWKDFCDGSIAVFGGSVFYGGLFGGLAVGYLYLRHYHLSLGDYSDLIVPAIPLFHFFGRLGCFTSGCCYGIPCTFGVTYHYSLAPFANNVTRFPVQLVESFLNLFLFFFLRKLQKCDRFRHKLLFVYLILYSIFRFFLEFLRGDSYRGFQGIFSTSQNISLVILFLVVCFSRKKTTNLKSK